MESFGNHHRTLAFRYVVPTCRLHILHNSPDAHSLRIQSESNRRVSQLHSVPDARSLCVLRDAAHAARRGAPLPAAVRRGPRVSVRDSDRRRTPFRSPRVARIHEREQPSRPVLESRNPTSLCL